VCGLHAKAKMYRPVQELRRRDEGGVTFLNGVVTLRRDISIANVYFV